MNYQEPDEAMDVGQQDGGAGPGLAHPVVAGIQTQKVCQHPKQKFTLARGWYCSECGREME